jgi:uncharacterized protein
MEIILWFVAVYALICVVVYFGNRLHMYFPDPTRTAPAEAGLDGVEEVEIVTNDGVTLVAWHAPTKKDKPTILYFHGNGANAANRALKIKTIRESGFGVFYLNNRGYGGSGGKPTEENNVTDAIAAYDYLTNLGEPADKIVAYGESLGSGQAVRLAAKRPIAAVVLEAPLTSTVDVARASYFWLPLGLLLTDKYNNEGNVRSVTAPVLVLHGEEDAVIPVEMGWRVYRAANEPKRIELFPQGMHSDLFDHGAWNKVQAFLALPSGESHAERADQAFKRKQAT